LRCEWGLQGLRQLAPESDAVIVVDVLSFSTAVEIAVARGATVWPYRWKDESAARFAAEKIAVLATGRGAAGYSLSPASLRLIPAGTSLVLPSPNGSTLSLSAAGTPTFTACLRNARAVAEFVGGAAARVAVIPAGEQWRDGSLRPCLEDWIGAGAVLSMLPGRRSPEAEMAAAAFEHFRGDLGRALRECASGRELIERGFACDVELAAELGVSEAVPRLVGGVFVEGGPRSLLPRRKRQQPEQDKRHRSPSH